MLINQVINQDICRMQVEILNTKKIQSSFWRTAFVNSLCYDKLS